MGLARTATTLATSERFAWAPIIGALAIDLADFATAGPLGLIGGLFIGGLLTFAVSLSAGARARRAMLFAVLGGLYCALPLTEALPLATMLTLIHGLLSRTAATTQEPAPVPIPITVTQVSPPRRSR